MSRFPAQVNIYRTNTRADQHRHLTLTAPGTLAYPASRPDCHGMAKFVIYQIENPFDLYRPVVRKRTLWLDSSFLSTRVVFLSTRPSADPMDKTRALRRLITASLRLRHPEWLAGAHKQIRAIPRTNKQTCVRRIFEFKKEGPADATAHLCLDLLTIPDAFR